MNVDLPESKLSKLSDLMSAISVKIKTCISIILFTKEETSKL